MIGAGRYAGFPVTPGGLENATVNILTQDGRVESSRAEGPLVRQHGLTATLLRAAHHARPSLIRFLLLLLLLLLRRAVCDSVPSIRLPEVDLGECQCLCTVWRPLVLCVVVARRSLVTTAGVP